MSNRRQFIQGSIALSALPLLAGSVLPAGAATLRKARPTKISKAIFDRDFTDSRVFAKEAARLGIATHAIAGDVTELWYEDLSERWKRGPAVIIGLTRFDSLFCLEQLARKHDLRVVFRASHIRRADRRIEHTLHGPATLLAQANPQTWRIGWGKEVARLTAAYAARKEAPVELRFATRTTAADEDLRLTSWVIAPKPWQA